MLLKFFPIGLLPLEFTQKAYWEPVYTSYVGLD